MVTFNMSSKDSLNTSKKLKQSRNAVTMAEQYRTPAAKIIHNLLNSTDLIPCYKIPHVQYYRYAAYYLYKFGFIKIGKIDDSLYALHRPVSHSWPSLDDYEQAGFKIVNSHRAFWGINAKGQGRKYGTRKDAITGKMIETW